MQLMQQKLGGSQPWAGEVRVGSGLRCPAAFVSQSVPDVSHQRPVQGHQAGREALTERFSEERSLVALCDGP